MGKEASAWSTKIQPRLAEIEAWARDGHNLHKIAGFLGVAERTLCRWRDVKPELSEALRHGRDYVDNVVVVSAYIRRITGYDVDEVRIEYTITVLEDGTEVRVPSREIHQTRHIPGDPRAAEWWLSRRQPEVYGRPAAEDGAAQPGIVIMPEPDADLLNGNGVEVSEGGGSDGRAG